jgi:hypothetical protein
MDAGRRQIHRQQGKALQDGFDKSCTLGPNLWLQRPMYAVEQFTRRDYGQKKLFLCRYATCGSRASRPRSASIRTLASIKTATDRGPPHG